jgi:hypothetical protein
MNTILVWVLITVGGYNGNEVSYSPPMADLESCQRLEKVVREGKYNFTQCVQIRIPK